MGKPVDNSVDNFNLTRKVGFGFTLSCLSATIEPKLVT